MEEKGIQKLIKQYLFLGLRAIEQWYWSLKALPRRIVGWCFVVSVAFLLGFGIYQGCRLVWLGGSAVVEWVADLFSSEPEPEPEPVAVDEFASLNYYSGDYKHREFPLGELNKKRRVHFSKDFYHVNATHLEAARRLGIRPQPNREALSQLTDKLVKLEDTRYYQLDPMSQSVPYLVPDAADFLTALGRRWQEYHGTTSRYIITSCTRTDADVKKLQKINVNSTKDSAHRYGTTIDITYVRFDQRGRTYEGKLKEDLARALYDLQEAGYCYVKHEVKQSCFHITVRPKH